jgi:MgtC family
VIQGILTGIGFLGAGVIMREGMSIRGLTTAASIWSSSAIGILVGIGFYAAAILLTMLSAVCMIWVHRLEHWLPSRSGVAIVVRFKRDFHPHEEVLRRVALERGYEVASGSLSITFESGHTEWLCRGGKRREKRRIGLRTGAHDVRLRGRGKFPTGPLSQLGGPACCRLIPKRTEEMV